MAKKNVLLISLALLVVGFVYYQLYKDSFHKSDIRIFHTIRPQPNARRGAPPSSAPNPELVIFGLNRACKLTSLKVISVTELETNKYAHPVWDLTTESNSAPIKNFYYGEKIRGMHPSIKGAAPDPLEPNVPYRLMVEAGGLKAQHDFKIAAEN